MPDPNLALALKTLVTLATLAIAAVVPDLRTEAFAFLAGGAAREVEHQIMRRKA